MLDQDQAYLHASMCMLVCQSIALLIRYALQQEGGQTAKPVQEDLTTFGGSVGCVRHPGHSQPKPGEGFLLYAGPCKEGGSNAFIAPALCLM